MAKRPKSSIPNYKRSRQRSWPRRILGWIVKLVLAFLIVSALWVLAYRFINPPITATMLGDVLAGRGATREWMEIEEIDRDMVRAVVAAEDSKFCQHSGFDWDSIEQAMQRNASGGRIRGGSTISQQTAKNAFLWQGGGYFRKGLEAWFTVLTEAMWDKRRIMEVYLNVAETGIGTYGVNAGSQRYFDHDSSAMSRQEAARIAAVLPLPKSRGAVAPKGFTRRYGSTIGSRIGVVARDGLDACVYRDIAPPEDRAPPRTRAPEVLPGEEYEAEQAAPTLENAVEELPPAPEAIDSNAVVPEPLTTQPPAPVSNAPAEAPPPVETPPPAEEPVPPPAPPPPPPSSQQ
jgi:monofunctional biosynthetic peptidoglycan transglycosylase